MGHPGAGDKPWAPSVVDVAPKKEKSGVVPTTFTEWVCAFFGGLALSKADQKLLAEARRKGLPVPKVEGKGQTPVLNFFSSREIKNLKSLVAKFVEGAPLPSSEIHNTMTPTSAQNDPDVAMGGRLLTDPQRRLCIVDGALYGGEATTVHQMVNEIDFFTAVDDVSEDRGSAHMGTRGFNSGVFHRYCGIHWDALVRNLGGDHGTALKAVEAFFYAMTEVSPKAKRHTYGNFGRVHYIRVDVTEYQPLNLDGAFNTVAIRGPGILGKALKRIRWYASTVADVFDQPSLKVLEMCLEEEGTLKRKDVGAQLRGILAETKLDPRIGMMGW
jgi:hypothetical protein